MRLGIIVYQIDQDRIATIHSKIGAVSMVSLAVIESIKISDNGKGPKSSGLVLARGTWDSCLQSDNSSAERDDDYQKNNRIHPVQMSAFAKFFTR